jgi:hypothetical protein
LDFYESTDWAFLFSICDDMSEYKRSAMMFAALDAAFEALLVTEGARRCARIELQDDVEDEAEVVDIGERRRRVGLVS